MSTDIEAIRPNYCFWCGSHESNRKPSHCYNCGYELGTYPPEIAALIKTSNLALLEEIEGKLPETLSRPKLHKMFMEEEIDWNKYCSELVVTDSINQVKKAIHSIKERISKESK